MTTSRGLIAPCASCSATDRTLPPLARVVLVDAALALVRAVLAPAVAAVAVPFAPVRAARAVPAAALPAVLAVRAAERAVDLAALLVLAAPLVALVRVLVVPDLAWVAVLAAPLRALVAVDLAPLRAAACVARAPVLRELELVRLPADRDEDDEVERPDDERLAGGIEKLLLLIDEGALAQILTQSAGANLSNVRAKCARRVQGFSLGVAWSR